jgi:hypothetical protein
MVALSFTKEMVQRIEEDRKDIPRSLYVRRIIDFYYKNNQKEGGCGDTTPNNQQNHLTHQTPGVNLEA